MEMWTGSKDSTGATSTISRDAPCLLSVKRTLHKVMASPAVAPVPALCLPLKEGPLTPGPRLGLSRL